MSNYTNNEILHVKCENGIEYLQFKKLNEYPELVHGVFLRHGGVSTGLYNSLNTRLAGKDTLSNVFENYNRICNSLNIDENKLCKAKQAHTDNVEYITQNIINEFNIHSLNYKEIDGYITNEENIFTVVTTADCIPVIIYDPIRKVVANVHSGWKGTTKQIYLKAINKMLNEFNCKVQDLIVCLGPSIGKCCFTSKEESFKENFIKVWPEQEKYIFYDKDKFHIDLKYLIKRDLESIGVKKENICDANICTKCNNNDFYSYRVTTQKGEADYGTFGTVVGIR